LVTHITPVSFGKSRYCYHRGGIPPRRFTPLLSAGFPSALKPLRSRIVAAEVTPNKGDRQPSMGKSLRYLGWALLAIAAAFLGHDLVLLLKNGRWDAVSLAELWSWIHEPSLDALRPQLEALWSPLWLWMAEILTWPVWAVFGAPGLLLTVSGRRQAKRRRWWK
jgi:hypothetical protein